MKIKIGEKTSVKQQRDTPTRSVSGSLESTFLSVRSPRKRGGRRSVEQHGSQEGLDTDNSRVLSLLVPEGYKIPQDIESKKYKIFLRFVPVAS